MIRYRDLVRTQLERSRKLITEKLGVKVDLVARPFGRYDEKLLRLAAEYGYVRGVTLDRRAVRDGDSIMALPRFLVTDPVWGGGFAALLPPEAR
jgi:peptidoglycan/xylan/chitin deacetylase (PgdA/CDA1 family)